VPKKFKGREEIWEFREECEKVGERVRERVRNAINS
jgi:hypothetical protein